MTECSDGTAAMALHMSDHIEGTFRQVKPNLVQRPASRLGAATDAEISVAPVLRQIERCWRARHVLPLGDSDEDS